MKFFASVVLLCFSPLLRAQESGDFAQWEKTSDTGRSVPYFTELEKDVIRELNKARTDPARYAQLYIAPTEGDFSGKINKKTNVQTQEGLSAVKECVAEMKHTSAMGLLTPNEILHRTAYDHTTAQSKTRQTGHTSPNGQTFEDRLRKYKFPMAAECISYGEDTAVDVVTALLIDDGVENRGHRKTILNNRLNAAGVAAGSHLVFGHMCTIDFSGGTPRLK